VLVGRCVFADDTPLPVPDPGRSRTKIGRSGISGSAEQSWPVVASLIETSRLDDVEPYAWLCDVLAKIVDGHPMQRRDESLPWRGSCFRVPPDPANPTAITLACSSEMGQAYGIDGPVRAGE